ncbi:MAG: hypothetical protein BMS9Abin05_1452 [Rhodothermia bacterium]|nr:MAG: hypothetical protein BMS9Abin05_1452 [Rhodothermia bacterium]
MAAVSISRVNSSGARRAFINYVYRLYKNDRYWIPPLRLDLSRVLNPKKNAFFEHGKIELFLAKNEGGTIVGRIAAIINGMHLKKYDDSVGFFGFFECEDDLNVAQKLFDTASDWLGAQGIQSMRGPVNPSLNDIAGLLVDGFERQPAILMPYNKAYYEQLLLDVGFERAMTMWSYYAHARFINEERLARGAKIVLTRNPSFTVRIIDMDNWESEARIMLDIFNDAWSENWGHVPMTGGEIKQLAHEMKMIVVPDLINFVEDNGEPIGFSASLPDLNYIFSTIRNGRLFPTGALKLLLGMKMKFVRETRMPLMGVKKTHQGRGIDALLVADILKRHRSIGMQGCEMSWVLDSNPRLMNFLDGIGGVKENEYALYEKALT